MATYTARWSSLAIVLACVMLGSASAGPADFAASLRGTLSSAAATAALAGRTATSPDTVATLDPISTTLGPVVGQVVSTSAGNAAQWLGIPYAASTGESAPPFAR